MFIRFYPFIALTVFLLLPAMTCADPLKSLVLYYDEIEEGVGAQTMRYMINSSHIRIDGGVNEADFILFDIKKRIILTSSILERW